MNDHQLIKFSYLSFLCLNVPPVTCTHMSHITCMYMYKYVRTHVYTYTEARGSQINKS